MSGCTTQECAVKMGKMLNVQKMIIGNLTKLADVYFITASIIDIETGEIAFSERIKAPTAAELADAAEELGVALIAGITGRGAVRRRPPKVYQPKRRTPRRPTAAPAAGEKRIYITEVIGPRKAKISIGFYDGVKKRYLYSIYRGAIKIGKLKITSVESEESTGRVIGLKPREKIELNMPLLYKREKWRTGGISGMFGTTQANAEDFDTGFCAGGFIELVFPPGIGFQAGSGEFAVGIEDEASSSINLYTTEYYDTDYYKNTIYKKYTKLETSYNTEVKFSYSDIFIVKLHLGRHNTLSPYVGIGTAKVIYTYDNTWSINKLWEIDGYNDNDYLGTWISSQNGSIDMGSGSTLLEEEDNVTVLNFGINLLATKTVHLILDYKSFGASEDMYAYGFETGMQATTFGLSINW